MARDDVFGPSRDGDGGWVEFWVVEFIGGVDTACFAATRLVWWHGGGLLCGVYCLGCLGCLGLVDQAFDASFFFVPRLDESFYHDALADVEFGGESSDFVAGVDVDLDVGSATG